MMSKMPLKCIFGFKFSPARGRVGSVTNRMCRGRGFEPRAQLLLLAQKPVFYPG